MRRFALCTWFLVFSAHFAASGCAFVPIFARNASAYVFDRPAAVPNKITNPVLSHSRLSALWVGHATVLIQIDDKFVLTDPVFTRTVGQFSPRRVEPGIDIESLPAIDLCLISHMHIDHLSVESIDRLEPRLQSMLVPEAGLVYVPNLPFPTDEVRWWQSVERNGLRVTAVPVDHSGYRYGADAAWMDRGYTAWVIEYNGLTVYFGGDTAYDRQAFVATAKRFPSIDLALLPIGPVEPAPMSRANHMDPAEALQAFIDLGADHMVPIHYDTFFHGRDQPGDAARLLRVAVERRQVAPERVHILAIGGQRSFISKGAPVADHSATQTRLIGARQ